jgi:hypothetical protein
LLLLFHDQCSLAFVRSYWNFYVNFPEYASASGCFGQYSMYKFKYMAFCGRTQGPQPKNTEFSYKQERRAALHGPNRREPNRAKRAEEKPKPLLYAIFARIFEQQSTFWVEKQGRMWYDETQ